MHDRLRPALWSLWACLPLQVGPVDPPSPAPARPAGSERSAAQDPAPAAQDPAAPTREQIWFSPSAQDWQKPCLIDWQRSFEDALDVSHRTKRPILVCVNMDGEIASEHYAGVRYRQPETARLFEPYVCVIASVYRHTPRDYDNDGSRIPCPRFGTVTCGEHIAIEPQLYERFFEERRVAPRHIMLEAGARESYDVYYALDTGSVLRTIEEGITKREQALPPRVEHDLPLAERLQSRDAKDRAFIERTWREATPEDRRALLARMRSSDGAVQLDVLRMALAGFDLEQVGAARGVLSGLNEQAYSEPAVDLLAEALSMPMTEQEREQLLATLARWGPLSMRARTLENVHRSLVKTSAAVDVERWTRELPTSAPNADASKDAYRQSADWSVGLSETERRLQRDSEDVAARTVLATKFLDAMLDPQTPRGARELYRADCRRNAEQALALGGSGFDLHAALAVTADQEGRREEALEHALRALESNPSEGVGARAVAVLEIVGRQRARQVQRAWREKREWPAEWMADLNSAYEVLARHPLGRVDHVCAQVDFLTWIGAKAGALAALERGMQRFPGAGELHERLRWRILRDQGVDALIPHYEQLGAAHPEWPDLDWFKGYAALIQAEHERRERKPDAAGASYAHSQAAFQRAIDARAEVGPSAQHYIALAQAGLARMAFERGENERAAQLLLSSWQESRSSAGALDGLGLSSVATAKALLDGAGPAGAEWAQRLAAALERLDPSALEPPEFERDPRGNRPSPDAERARRPSGG